MRIITALHHRLPLAWTVVSLTAIASAGDTQDLKFSASRGVLVASLPDDTPVWEVRTPDGQVPHWEVRADGNVWLESGVVLGPHGEVLARTHGGLHVPLLGRGDPQASCAGWDPLAEVSPPPPEGTSDSHTSPLFDSLGNAWVILTHLVSGDYSLQVRRSNGHTGTWQPLETISDTTNYVSTPEGAIDPDDNITIVFRDIQAGYKLYAMGYEPGSGWSGPDLVYTTSTFFQAIEIAADADGNIPVITDSGFSPDKTVQSTVYDADTGTWSSPQQISPTGYDTLLPTVVQNRAGDVIYLVYLVKGGGPTGLYAHRFDSTTKTWGPAVFLPGSTAAGYTIAVPVSRLPATVDSLGNATVLWQTALPGPYGVYASRTDNGVWQDAYELLAPGPDDTDIENFADADSNDRGDAFGVITRYESGSNRLYAFRYHASDGWQTPENPYTSTLNFSTRVRICFYRGAHAVATLYGWQDSLDQLTSLIYTGTMWLPDLLDVPENHKAYFQETQADQGEALLVYEGELGPLGSDNRGILATWLRTSPGDFDCDGDVDPADFAAFESCFTGSGGGPIDPQCAPGDFDGDGDVDCDDWDQFVLAWTSPDDPPGFPPCAGAIPTVSEWGLVLMTLLLLTTGTMVLRRGDTGSR